MAIVPPILLKIKKQQRMALPIFLELGKIRGFSTPNISGLKKGDARKSQ